MKTGKLKLKPMAHPWDCFIVTQYGQKSEKCWNKNNCAVSKKKASNWLDFSFGCLDIKRKCIKIKVYELHYLSINFGVFEDFLKNW